MEKNTVEAYEITEEIVREWLLDYASTEEQLSIARLGYALNRDALGISKKSSKKSVVSYKQKPNGGNVNERTKRNR